MRYDMMLCPRCKWYAWSNKDDSTQYVDYCKIHGALDAWTPVQKYSEQCGDFERRKKGGKR